MKRKICVITGSRAEYGLLQPLMEEVKSDSTLKLQLIATGMHMSRAFGLTYKQIEKDGFAIDEKIDICLSSDTPAGISKSMGMAMIGFGKVYRKLKPDIIVVLGDRFELLGVVASALVSRVPVAHIQGGELTQGAFDESIRHAITKMSHLHFTSTEVYRRRVVQLGEDPNRVFNVGALGLDNIRKLDLLSKKDLERRLKFSFKRHNFLITFHPVTLEDNNTAGKYFQNLLNVLDELKDIGLIFTKANADTGGRLINGMIDRFVGNNSGKAVLFDSMGQLKYLSTMRLVDAVVGNSSSAIIETPSFKVGAINIGDRQAGRIRAANTIDCKPTRKGIKNAIKILYSDRFQRNLKKITNPYGDGRSSGRIKDVLKTHDLSNILKKSFYDK